MDFIAVTFRSRNHTLRFCEILKRKGVSCGVINTPKEAGVGCGLSAKVSPEYFGYAKKITHALGFSSFAGFFYVKQVGNKRIVKSI